MKYIIESHDGINVLRDDLLTGGSKTRYIHKILDKNKKGYVYASPVYGAFQIALAHYCKENNKKCVIFCAGRNERHKNTIEVLDTGANLQEITNGGFLRNVQIKAKNFVEANPEYQYIEFGTNSETSINEISKITKKIIKKLGKEPDEIYCAVGSGTLLTGILKGTTTSKITGVIVGKPFELSDKRVRLITYPKKFEVESKFNCPFKSSPNYDLKAYEICMKMKGKGSVLFWNVY